MPALLKARLVSLVLKAASTHWWHSGGISALTAPLQGLSCVCHFTMTRSPAFPLRITLHNVQSGSRTGVQLRPRSGMARPSPLCARIEAAPNYTPGSEGFLCFASEPEASVTELPHFALLNECCCRARKPASDAARYARQSGCWFRETSKTQLTQDRTSPGELLRPCSNVR